MMDMIRQEKLDMTIMDSTDRDHSLYFRKLYRRDFYVAFPESNPLVVREFIEPQVVFNYDVGKSFKEWASGSPTDESVLCTVDTAQSALDLVAAGAGIAFIPDKCVQPPQGVHFIPLKNWDQALYMCILYDKWLEPPVWDFVELVVANLRKLDASGQ